MKSRLLLCVCGLVASLALGACAAATAGSAPAAAAEAALSLAGKAWSLATLEGAAVEVPDERARPTLAFDAEGRRVSGLAAVNRFSGTCTQENAKLKFGPLLVTKMAGAPELNELETRFLRALEATTGWRTQGDQLELLAGDQVVARFSSRKK